MKTPGHTPAGKRGLKENKTRAAREGGLPVFSPKGFVKVNSGFADTKPTAKEAALRFRNPKFCILPYKLQKSRNTKKNARSWIVKSERLKEREKQFGQND